MRSRRRPHDPRPRRWRSALGTALTFLLPMGTALALLWPAFGGGLLADDYLINVYLDRSAGTDVRVDWASVWRDAHGPWLGLEGSAIYRPLIALQYGIDIALGGGDPVYLHVSNGIVHVATVGAVCWLAFALATRSPRRTACIAGTLFALHPACLETAVWISGRVTGTQVLWSMLCVASFAWARRRMRVEWLALSWVSAALALLSKESALVLPALLLLVDVLVRMPTTWTGALGRHLLFAPLWIAYLLARHAFLGTFFGEGLAGWEPSDLDVSPHEILIGTSAKLTALAAPFADLFGTFRGFWVPDPGALAARLARPAAFGPFLEAAALLASVLAVVVLVVRGARSWLFGWMTALGLLAILVTFAPTYAFPIGRDLGGMRHLYEGAGWMAVIVACLAGEVRPWSVREGSPLARATAALLALALLVWGGGLLGSTLAGRARYAWAFEEVARVERALQAAGEDASPRRPLAVVSTPSFHEGVPLVRPNAVYALGEPPNAPRDVPIVGLNCTLERVLHSEPLYLDAAPLRALLESGGTLLFWDPGAGRFLEVRRDPRIDALPEVLDLGAGHLVVRFADLPGSTSPAVSPFWIEQVDVAVAGRADGGILSWSVPAGGARGKRFVAFGPGRSVGEGDEEVTHFAIDLSHAMTFFTTEIEGGVAGFELAFDPPLDGARVLAFQLRKRVERLAAMGTPLDGNGVRVGEESVLLHPPAGPVPDGHRRSLVLLGQHAGLVVPVEGNVVRFDETVARDLRRIARMMRTPRVWFYWIEEPDAGQAWPARRSAVDWFTLRPPP